MLAGQLDEAKAEVARAQKRDRPHPGPAGQDPHADRPDRPGVLPAGQPGRAGRRAQLREPRPVRHPAGPRAERHALRGRHAQQPRRRQGRPGRAAGHARREARADRGGEAPAGGARRCRSRVSSRTPSTPSTRSSRWSSARATARSGRSSAERAAERSRLAAAQAQSRALARSIEAAADRAASRSGLHVRPSSRRAGAGPANGGVSAVRGLSHQPGDRHPELPRRHRHRARLRRADHRGGCRRGRGRPRYTAWDGNTTVIAHGGGMTTWYAHQNSFGVHVGQHVSRGQVIGSRRGHRLRDRATPALQRRSRPDGLRPDGLVRWPDAHRGQSTVSRRTTSRRWL